MKEGAPAETLPIRNKFSRDEKVAGWADPNLGPLYIAMCFFDLNISPYWNFWDFGSPSGRVPPFQNKKLVNDYEVWWKLYTGWPQPVAPTN